MWNPVGDQYVVAYDTTLSVCDVQVSIAHIIDQSTSVCIIQVSYRVSCNVMRWCENNHLAYAKVKSQCS